MTVHCGREFQQGDLWKDVDDIVTGTLGSGLENGLERRPIN
jgi:hypothetical protein